MIVITAATGKLGTLVVERLLERVSPDAVRLAVRTPDRARRWAERGVEVVRADYGDRESLERAFAGAQKVLLISSSEVGQRAAQHANAIDAAVQAGVGHLVYTSLLKADTSRSLLAEEHVATERKLAASGLSHTVLRNGWYIENYTENLETPLQLGAFHGAARSGRIAAATRADFAEAAVAVLTGEGHAGQTYELGGEAFTMAELAATVAEATERAITYVDLPEADYRGALIDAGVPEAFAQILANADVAIAEGDLDAPSDDLVALLGRPATPLREAVRAALS